MVRLPRPQLMVGHRTERQMTLHVTVTDIETSDTDTVEVPEGDYLLICHEPCHLQHTNAYANGTQVLTIKGRTNP